MQHIPAETWRVRGHTTSHALPGYGATLILLIVLAVVLRATPLAIPHSFFADEVFQYLEAAHRLVFGQGVVTWEFRYHVRNWLLPLFLAGPMRLGDLLAPHGQAYLLLPKLALLALSLLAVHAAAILGGLASRLHVLFATFVVATWYEYVYFATQALTEAAAVPIALSGMALAYASGSRPRHLLGAGMLLGAAVLLRFQYGPAIAAFAILVFGRTPRRWAWLALGAAVAVLVSAGTDIAMDERPFAWLTANIHQNITLGRSRIWIEGPFFYPVAIATVWGMWLLPLLALALIGARRYPAMLATSAVNILALSCVAHKEYRYVLLSTMIVALLAAIGTGDALAWVRRRAPSISTVRLSIAAGIAWLLASASLAAGVDVRLWWTRGTPDLRALMALHEEPRLCGVALAGIPWSAAGGYTYLHRTAPMLVYAPDERSAWNRDAALYNGFVAYEGTAPPPGFVRTACFRTADRALATCVAVRPGECASRVSPREINRMLIRIDR